MMKKTMLAFLLLALLAFSAAASAEGQEGDLVEGDVLNAHVVLHGVRASTEMTGQQLAVLSFSWTNTGEKASIFGSAVRVTVSQEGKELMKAILPDDVDTKPMVTTIEPGDSIDLEVAYRLDGSAPLEIAITGQLDFQHQGGTLNATAPAP